MSTLNKVYVNVPSSRIKIQEVAAALKYKSDEQVAEEIQQLVSEALESFSTRKKSYVTIRHKGVEVKVPIEVSATLDPQKLRTELKKTHKVGSVTWGTSAHNTLYMQQTDKPTFNKDYSNGVLLQLRSLGYLDDKNKITDIGQAKLKELDERGPVHKRELNKLAETIIYSLAYKSGHSPVINKYIIEHKYIHATYDRPSKERDQVEILPKGIAFMEANVKRLQKMKAFKYHTERLIRFLPLEELPKYITSDKAAERKYAQLRFEDFEKGGGLDE